MEISIIEIGTAKHRVVIIDNFHETPSEIIELAASMVPFPVASSQNFYPGKRRIFGKDDFAAIDYVNAVLGKIAPIIQKTYNAKSLALINGSFSMVTTPPEHLNFIQLHPHYDSTEANDLAILHYLSPQNIGATSFYRHRATGLEMVDNQSAPIFVETIKRQVFNGPKRAQKYIDESNDLFESIAKIDGIFNRLVIYQGAIFHCSNMPKDFDYNDDPKKGRLTTNIFAKITF